MATNMYKKYTESKTREWDDDAMQLPAAATPVAPGVVIKNTLSGEIGITLTGSGLYAASAGIPGDSWHHHPRQDWSLKRLLTLLAMAV